MRLRVQIPRVEPMLMKPTTAAVRMRRTPLAASERVVRARAKSPRNNAAALQNAAMANENVRAGRQ